MEFGSRLLLSAVCLGIGLAVDAFSVSLANGLHEPQMKTCKICGIAGTFAIFQAIMPMLGWFCIHTIVRYFQIFEHFIPWIAFVLLESIGGKMLREGSHPHCSADSNLRKHNSLCTLLLQGIATSVDALSVGLTIAKYNVFSALLTSTIIALITFILCLIGVFIGKQAGMRLSGKAEILGGLLLIIIGMEILLNNLL